MGWTTKLNWWLQDFWTINSKTTRDNWGVLLKQRFPKRVGAPNKKQKTRGGCSVGVLLMYIYIYLYIYINVSSKKGAFFGEMSQRAVPFPYFFMKYDIFWKLSENESGSWPLLTYSALEISKHCKGKGDSVMLVGFVLFSSLLLVNMPPLATHLPPQH